jgi:hypothetical protein
MSRITYADLVIDAVLSTLRALPTYRAPTDTGSTELTTVYDGPEVLHYTDNGRSFLVVGYGGEDVWDPGESSDDATRGDVSVRAIATTSPKEEEASIDCLAVYKSGDFDVSTSRAAVVAIGSDVDTALRAAPKVGIGSSATGQLLWTQVTEWSLRSYLRGGLFVAELRFTLTYHART